MNARRLTLVTFTGLTALFLIVGGVASLVLTQGVRQTVMELQSANSEEYGRRFAASMEAQLQSGNDPQRILRQFQHSLLSTPTDNNRYLCIISDEATVLCHPDEGVVGNRVDAMRLQPWGSDQVLSFSDWLGVGGDLDAFMLGEGGKPVQLIRRIPVEGTNWSILVHTRLEALDLAIGKLNGVILWILIPTGLLLIFGGTFIARLLGRRYEMAMMESNALLEDRVRQRTFELEATVSELHQARNALILKEKVALLGTLVAGIAHEIRNPLAGIQLISESLAEDEEDPDAREGLKKIHASASRCNQLVVSLLAFARNDPPRRVEVSIQELLDKALSLSSPEIRRLEIELIKEFGAGNPKLHVDPIQLEQVFLNLLGNACQELERREGGRRIRLETSLIDKHLVLAIEDNGRGVPDDIVPKLFEPFQTTKSEGEGTGLGLSLCKRFIEHHGGTIHYRKGEWEGARFEVRLPLDG